MFLPAIAVLLTSALAASATNARIEFQTVQNADAPNNWNSSDVPRLRNITYGGDGCPQGSLDRNIDPSGDRISLIGNPIAVYSGPNITYDRGRKRCQLNVDFLSHDMQFRPKPGAQSWPQTASGYMVLDAGITVEFKTTLYYSGNQEMFTSTVKATGPRRGAFTLVNTVPETPYSSCNPENAINLSRDVRLTSTDKNASGVVYLDLEYGVDVNSGFEWRKCTATRLA